MFLQKLDMLSPKITLYYRKKNIHGSVISGVLTIIAYSLIFLLTFYYFIRYINRENPTAYYFNRYVNDAGSFSLKNSNFFNYIQIFNTRERTVKELDFNKIEIIGINSMVERLINSGDNIDFSHWIYGKCNESDRKGLGELLNNDIFYKSACIKKYYKISDLQYYNISEKNFEWPDIRHGASNPDFSFYGVAIRKCQNTTFRLKHIGACSPENEIDTYLRNTYLSFTILDHYVDVLNYKEPITKFLYSVTNVINSDIYITNNLNFNPGLVKTYDNLITDNTEDKATYFFHENAQSTSSSENNNLLGVFYLWLQNGQQYYERRYPQIQDALPQIGGFGSVVIMIAKCINFLICRFVMLSDTQKLISNVLNDNNTVYERIRKSPSIKLFMSDNNIRKKDNIQHVRLFHSERNIQKRINTENSNDDLKEENNKIISKRINIINKNNNIDNLGDETNRNSKNLEIKEQNVIPEQKIEAFEEITTKYAKKLIKLNFARIKKKEKFNCFHYFCYLISCKKINPKIRYYEILRRLIISEEIMFQNYLSIYKLLEYHQDK